MRLLKLLSACRRDRCEGAKFVESDTRDEGDRRTLIDDHLSILRSDMHATRTAVQCSSVRAYQVERDVSSSGLLALGTMAAYSA
jgi:hypothetical protein